MREIYNNFTSLKTQAITVTLKQGKKLVINVLKNPEKLLTYKKTAKKTTEQIIYILINPVLPLKTIIKKPSVYKYK